MAGSTQTSPSSWVWPELQGVGGAITCMFSIRSLKLWDDLSNCAVTDTLLRPIIYVFFRGYVLFRLSHLSHPCLEADTPCLSSTPVALRILSTEKPSSSQGSPRRKSEPIPRNVITEAEAACNLMRRRQGGPFHPMSKLDSLGALHCVCPKCQEGAQHLLIPRKPPTQQPPWAESSTPVSGLHLLSANGKWSVGSEDVFANILSGGAAID